MHVYTLHVNVHLYLKTLAKMFEKNKNGVAFFMVQMMQILAIKYSAPYIMQVLFITHDWQTDVWQEIQSVLIYHHMSAAKFT